MATLLVQPSGALQIRVRKAINEDPQMVPEKLAQVKVWLAEQPHLPPFDDDARIMSFLRGCKFDLEKTKRKLDNYFTVRTAAPEIFSDRDPIGKGVQRAWDECQFLPLRVLTAEGNRIMWLNSPFERIDVASAHNNIKLDLMIGDMRLALEQEGVGDVYVVDVSYGTLEQFAKFSPAFIKKFLTCIKLAYPARVRQVHLIKMNSVVEYVMGLIKPLITDKIRGRIYHHGKDYEDTLCKYVPKELWPNEFGGKSGSISKVREAWRSNLESHRQWFLDQDEVKSDESKRPGPPLDLEELVGSTRRSFQKLNLD